MNKATNPTWRERIVRAQLRGTFNWYDRKDVSYPATCAWGEMNQTYGLGLLHNGAFFKERSIENQGYNFYRTISENCFSGAEELLNAIEDKALQIKRERVA